MAEPSTGTFAATLDAAAPPADWPAPLAALWWAAKGARENSEKGAGGSAWERAHALVQDASGPDAAWVHAHLHRVEGDLGNAGYWYRRAGRPEARGSLADERSAIAQALMHP